MFLKPVSGRQVPDPDKGGFLPAEGGEVEPHQYWYKRIQDGDVVEVTEDQPATRLRTTPRVREQGEEK